MGGSLHGVTWVTSKLPQSYVDLFEWATYFHILFKWMFGGHKLHFKGHRGKQMARMAMENGFCAN